MHIVHVSPIVYLDLFISREMARIQTERGHRVSVVGWSENSKTFSIIPVANGPIIYLLPGIDFPLNNMVAKYPFIFNLSNFLCCLNFDIMHIQTHLRLAALSSIDSAKKTRKPVVVTIHGVIGKANFVMDKMQQAYLYTVGRFIFRNASKIICLTRMDAVEIAKYGCPAEKISVIPNGVDVELFKPSGKEEENLVVWSGRFVPPKGLEYLVKAARIIVNEHDDVKFLLTGEGPLRPKIMKLARKCDLNKNMIFAGRLPLKEIPSILAKASVCILPSLKEGMPWALLEAMACGKPVIGSNIPGINDLITHGQNGLLVPPRNPEGLANAVLTLLNDETFRRRFRSKRQAING